MIGAVVFDVGEGLLRAITSDLGEDTRTVRRTTTQPVRSFKKLQPRKAAHVS